MHDTITFCLNIYAFTKVSAWLVFIAVLLTGYTEEECSKTAYGRIQGKLLRGALDYVDSCHFPFPR